MLLPAILGFIYETDLAVQIVSESIDYYEPCWQYAEIEYGKMMFNSKTILV